MLVEGREGKGRDLYLEGKADRHLVFLSLKYRRIARYHDTRKLSWVNGLVSGWMQELVCAGMNKRRGDVLCHKHLLKMDMLPNTTSVP